MFLRALRVCSEEFLEDEINFIFDIGKKHKYPMDNGYFRQSLQ